MSAAERAQNPRVIVRLLALLLVAGCGGSEPALQRGQEVFGSPAFSPADSNVFSCATCHQTTATGNGLELPGYLLHDAAARPSWWGGAYDTLLDAVNECYVEFMRGPRLATDDVDGRALLVYLQSIAPDATAPALPLTVEKDIVTDPMAPGWIPTGDAGRGAHTYQVACANCHGTAHTGDGRLGDKVSIIPDESIAQHGCMATGGARPITIEKVRHGKFFGVGGNMPLYSVEAFSDAELGDVLAYLGTFAPAGCF